jgi:hypothetical protein
MSSTQLEAVRFAIERAEKATHFGKDMRDRSVWCLKDAIMLLQTALDSVKADILIEWRNEKK